MEFAPPSFVEVAGRRLAYGEVRPAQPRGTIFLLTGLGSKRQGWRNQLAVFGKEYRTLAVDFRDVGDSERVDQPYTVADLADDVAGMARALPDTACPCDRHLAWRLCGSECRLAPPRSGGKAHPRLHLGWRRNVCHARSLDACSARDGGRYWAEACAASPTRASCLPPTSARILASLTRSPR